VFVGRDLRCLRGSCPHLCNHLWNCFWSNGQLWAPCKWYLCITVEGGLTNDFIALSQWSKKWHVHVTLVWFVIFTTLYTLLHEYPLNAFITLVFGQTGDDGGQLRFEFEPVRVRLAMWHLLGIFRFLFAHFDELSDEVLVWDFWYTTLDFLKLVVHEWVELNGIIVYFADLFDGLIGLVIHQYVLDEV